MTEKIDLDILFLLAENEPLWSEIEGELRATGLDERANFLLKLQQDAGLEIEWEMNGKDEVAPGPETARLWAAYEPLSLARLNILHQLVNDISDSSLRGELLSVTQKIPVLSVSSIPEPLNVNQLSNP